MTRVTTKPACLSKSRKTWDGYKRTVCQKILIFPSAFPQIVHKSRSFKPFLSTVRFCEREKLGYSRGLELTGCLAAFFCISCFRLKTSMINTPPFCIVWCSSKRLSISSSSVGKYQARVHTYRCSESLWLKGQMPHVRFYQLHAVESGFCYFEKIWRDV